jgi:Mrp family chromosome partitioning ATPase
LVIEADLHYGTLAKRLGLSSWTGLAECLQGEAAPLSAIRRVEPLGWYLLPAGQTYKNTELLQTPEIGKIIQKVSTRFEWILIDSPPAVPVTDALALQQHADATLLAVRAGKTPRDLVEHAVTLLGREHILGIVMNGVEGLDHLYYNYGSSRGSARANRQAIGNR